MKAQFGALVIVAALLTAACGASTPAGSSGSIDVFAAASLTDSFKAEGRAFEQAHGGAALTFNFAGTPTLLTQIEQGAPADVFASADQANMDRLTEAGYALGTPSTFAHNRLEIVVAPGNPRHIAALADLARPGVVYITEAPTVPAGQYSVEALQKAGVAVTPKSQETDVKAVISKIELGEADAGIVYATDVRAAGDRVQGVPIPDMYNVVATYPIVTVKATRNSALAKAFVAFVLSAAGQSILESYGFAPAG